MTTQEYAPTAGLCQTCANAAGCFHRARRGPALLCELFDGDALPNVRHNGRAVLSAATDPDPPAALPTIGLCLNCEHRRTCAHSRPEGGVWHCEHYA